MVGVFDAVSTIGDPSLLGKGKRGSLMTPEHELFAMSDYTVVSGRPS